MENLAVMNQDFYQQLRDKIAKWFQSDEGKKYKFAEYLMLVPDLFHLICKLAIDSEVLVADKAKLALVIVYFISPLDLIPEAVAGAVGYADDIVLVALALNSIINHTDPEIVKKHWAGDGDVLDVIKNILAVADEMVGKGLVFKLKGVLGK